MPFVECARPRAIVTEQARKTVVSLQLRLLLSVTEHATTQGCQRYFERILQDRRAHPSPTVADCRSKYALQPVMLMHTSPAEQTFQIAFMLA